MIEYGVIFFTGALAGLHCIGMCGAVVLAYSLQVQTGAAAARYCRAAAQAAGVSPASR